VIVYLILDTNHHHYHYHHHYHHHHHYHSLPITRRNSRKQLSLQQQQGPLIKSLQEGYENTRSAVDQLKEQMAVTSETMQKQQFRARRKLEEIAKELQNKQLHHDSELLSSVKALVRIVVDGWMDVCLCHNHIVYTTYICHHLCHVIMT
jgi:hypothetical protein